MADTPIPSRAVEYSSKGTSGLREYTLSPEELEEIRQKYPATKRDKEFKKPIVQNVLTKEDKDMAKFKMTADEYFGERQAGKSQEQIAEEQGVTPQAIDYHLKKWGAEGKQVEPDKTQLLREKKVLPQDQRPSTDLEHLNKAVKEIERLTLEVSAKDEAKEVLQRRLESAESEAKQWRMRTGDAVAARDSVQNELVEAYEERDALRDELDRLITERGEMVAENERLERRMVDAHGEATRAWSEVEKLRDMLGHPMLASEPVSETQLLDRSIAELTRARKIIKLLSASGE